MASHLETAYKPPKWAGKPPPGLHLDVLKGEKLVQKLMVDEKEYYLFGRNNKMCDFIIDHASCSRLHAALVWHKNLERMFLIDLGSVHGTYIRSIRLDPDKPQHVPIDSLIHFGASTRNYVLRERPLNYGLDNNILSILSDDSKNSLKPLDSSLPEDEVELDNLTEFNTAHNRRITALGLDESAEIKKNINTLQANPYSSLNPLVSSLQSSKKEKTYSIRFSVREEIINPEDVDPTIGRYRNMVQTVVVPKVSAEAKNPLALQTSKTLHPNLSKDCLYNYAPKTNLYEDLSPENGVQIMDKNAAHSTLPNHTALNNGKPIFLNSAPPVEIPPNELATENLTEPPKKRKAAPDDTVQSDTETFPVTTQPQETIISSSDKILLQDVGSLLPHKKKKYAKEAWPGKRSANTNLPTSLLV